MTRENNGQNPASAAREAPADEPAAPSTGRSPGYGLRNPWRFSFDRKTGDLVHRRRRAERARGDRLPAARRAACELRLGAVRGEPHVRGETSSSTRPTPLVFPISRYGHGEGCSVTGGYVYRGKDGAGGGRALLLWRLLLGHGLEPAGRRAARRPACGASRSTSAASRRSARAPAASSTSSRTKAPSSGWRALDGRSSSIVRTTLASGPSVASSRSSAPGPASSASSRRATPRCAAATRASGSGAAVKAPTRAPDAARRRSSAFASGPAAGRRGHDPRRSARAAAASCRGRVERRLVDDRRRARRDSGAAHPRARLARAAPCRRARRRSRRDARSRDDPARRSRPSTYTPISTPTASMSTSTTAPCRPGTNAWCTSSVTA